ncbi:MAG: hypothetical protein IT289_08780 [Oligoflexia bacterium]|nr:hypothetical protein [Oligoflexia bacterium]
MKISIMVFALAMSLTAQGFAFTLADGITLCPEKQNPMTVLKDQGANRFAGERQISQTPSVVLVELLHDPSVYNESLSLPIKLVGMMRLEMGYESNPGNPHDRPLYCKVDFKSGSCPIPSCANPPEACYYDFTQAPTDEFGCWTGCGPLICARE